MRLRELFQFEATHRMFFILFPNSLFHSKPNLENWSSFPDSSVDFAFQCRKCGFDPWTEDLRSHMPHDQKPKA